MAKVNSRKNTTQKEFDAEMKAVRKAISLIEYSREKSATEKLRIASVAKKSSTVQRLHSMRKKWRKQNALGEVTTKW